MFIFQYILVAILESISWLLQIYKSFSPPHPLSLTLHKEQKNSKMGFHRDLFSRLLCKVLGLSCFSLFGFLVCTYIFICLLVTCVFMYLFSEDDWGIFSDLYLARSLFSFLFFSHLAFILLFQGELFLSRALLINKRNVINVVKIYLKIRYLFNSENLSTKGFPKAK